MTTHDFLDPRALRADLDAAHRAELPARGAPPIFVLGLHRSGTTWLYQVLADLFPVAVTTLYHVTHYRRLVHARLSGLEAGYRADLTAALAARGIVDRGIDGVGVGPDALEEYAFILRKFAGAWGYGPRSASLLDDVMRKLTWLQPEGRALLLKNPFDLATAPALLARYPDAKFVFIRRDPVRVLNSQFRNHFVYRRGDEPYLGVLLAGIPLWRANFRLLAAADRLLPDRAYQAAAVHAIRRGLETQLRRHYAGLAALPRACWHEVAYEDLVADPAPAIEGLRAFLDLPFREGAAPPAANPRLEPVHPTVAASADAVRRALAAYPDARLGAPEPTPGAPAPHVVGA
jgi:hypothetical protein